MKKALLFFIIITNFSLLMPAGEPSLKWQNVFKTMWANKGAVVCVHGFLRSCKSMIPMGHALKNQGFEIYFWDYQSRKKTIEGHAENLVKMLQTIALEKPGEPIYFVTHSLGGVILRAAVNHPDCPAEAKMGKAVLLAPPNKGASLARAFREYTAVQWLFGKRAGMQLLEFDETAMQQLGQFPDSMTILVIAGEKAPPLFGIWFQEPNDGKVTIEETRLETPHYHHTLYVSHSWIMTSRESIAITKDFLNY